MPFSQRCLSVAHSCPLLPVVARSFQQCLLFAHSRLQFPIVAKVSSPAYQLHTVACRVSHCCQWLPEVSSSASQLPIVVSGCQKFPVVPISCPLLPPEVSSSASQLNTVACSFPLLPKVSSHALQLHTQLHGSFVGQNFPAANFRVATLQPTEHIT